MNDLSIHREGWQNHRENRSLLLDMLRSIIQRDSLMEILWLRPVISGHCCSQREARGISDLETAQRNLRQLKNKRSLKTLRSQPQPQLRHAAVFWLDI